MCCQIVVKIPCYIMSPPLDLRGGDFFLCFQRWNGKVSDAAVFFRGKLLGAEKFDSPVALLSKPSALSAIHAVAVVGVPERTVFAKSTSGDRSAQFFFTHSLVFAVFFHATRHLTPVLPNPSFPLGVSSNSKLSSGEAKRHGTITS